MDPWTSYWQADRPQSCLPADPAVERAVDGFWVGFAGGLSPTARLVDLATGNGAVPLALRRAGLALPITAVDRAGIDPHRFLSQASLLRDVQFLAGVDLGTPGALRERFDAATSQFGIEYLPAGQRAPLLAEALVPGGCYLLLMHHAASDVVTPRRRDLEELERLTAPHGIGEALNDFGAGRAPAAPIDAACRRHLRQDHTMTRRLSGDVLASAARILSLAEAGAAEAATLAADLAARLEAEQTRLALLAAAALDDPGARDLVQDLEAAGLAVETCEPWSARDSRDATALVGWRVTGAKR